MMVVGSWRVAREAMMMRRGMMMTTKKSGRRLSGGAARSVMPRLELLRESLALAKEANQPQPATVRATKASRGEAVRDGRFLIETRGCQMNVSDGEIMRGVLLEAGYEEARSEGDASILVVNTCAIRDKAEAKVWGRLREVRSPKRFGGPRRTVVVAGCMAERVKDALFENGLADAVVGPDAYRDLPKILDAGGGINTDLSVEETYADIAPVRRSPTQPHGAFVSIQRGCSNMCSFCIVPFVRGRDRSRDAASVVDECRALVDAGAREITLLGQNVNSYAHFGFFVNPGSSSTLTAGIAAATDIPAPSSLGGRRVYSPGFEAPFVRSAKRDADDTACRFADLLMLVADAVPEARIRFTSPHPKDFPDVLLDAVAAAPNVAKQLHLPAQSGSSAVLNRMRRAYTEEAYRALVDRARARIPGVGLSSDFIAGFCGETEEDHRATVRLLQDVQYDQAFLFAYSMRPQTHAHRRLEDDVPPETKKRRLAELMDVYDVGRRKKAEDAVGSEHLVLVEGPPAREPLEADLPHQGPFVAGRNDANRKLVFPARTDDGRTLVPGDFAVVRALGTNGTTLFGTALQRGAAAAS